MDAMPHRAGTEAVVRARLLSATTRPTLDELAAAVAAGWAADTAWIDDWDAANPARGQCGSTALVVQDHRGGTLVRALVDPGGAGQGPAGPVVHYWTVADIGQVDLTWHQFPAGSRIVSAPPVERTELLAGDWFVDRYLTLARRVDRRLAGDRQERQPTS